MEQQPQRQEVVWKDFIQTEGWPAGLHNSLRSQNTDGVQNWHQKFTMSILNDELWHDFSESEQHFLLATSILNTMNQQVCNALLENKNSSVHLESLVEKGFFIEKDRKDATYYRCHSLFAAALQQNLQKMCPKESVAALHKKAAGIYFRLGNIAQAVTHALKGKAYPLAGT